MLSITLHFCPLKKRLEFEVNYKRLLNPDDYKQSFNYSVIAKQDELLPDSAAKHHRLIFNPDPQLKAFLGLLNFTVQSVVFKMPMHETNVAIGRSANELLLQVVKWIPEFVEPIFLSFDLSNFDSMQFKEFQEVVDNPWIEAAFNKLLLSNPELQGNPKVYDMLDKLKSKEINVRLEGKDRTKIPNLPKVRSHYLCKLVGVMPSGSAIQTTFGNSMRNRSYLLFVAAKAGVFTRFLVAGDDSVVIINKGDLDKYLKALFICYAIMDGLEILYDNDLNISIPPVGFEPILGQKLKFLRISKSNFVFMSCLFDLTHNIAIKDLPKFVGKTLTASKFGSDLSNMGKQEGIKRLALTEDFKNNLLTLFKVKDQGAVFERFKSSDIVFREKLKWLYFIIDKGFEVYQNVHDNTMQYFSPWPDFSLDDPIDNDEAKLISDSLKHIVKFELKINKVIDNEKILRLTNWIMKCSTLFNRDNEILDWSESVKDRVNSNMTSVIINKGNVINYDLRVLLTMKESNIKIDIKDEFKFIKLLMFKNVISAKEATNLIHNIITDKKDLALLRGLLNNQSKDTVLLVKDKPMIKKRFVINKRTRSVDRNGKRMKHNNLLKGEHENKGDKEGRIENNRKGKMSTQKPLIMNKKNFDSFKKESARRGPVTKLRSKSIDQMKARKRRDPDASKKSIVRKIIAKATGVALNVDTTQGRVLNQKINYADITKKIDNVPERNLILLNKVLRNVDSFLKFDPSIRELFVRKLSDSLPNKALSFDNLKSEIKKLIFIYEYYPNILDQEIDLMQARLNK